MQAYARVSVHGGHSGTYCNHARDTLSDVVARYVELDFAWVCLTEHMPPQHAHLMGPEEAAEGFTTADLHARFSRYFAEARQLAEQYADQIDLLVGFETEGYTGYADEVRTLIETHQPDMLVGSVHHVQDILFDASAEHYAQAISACGGVEAMYCEYFDTQLELLQQFEPAVVGHFDLIRIYDPDYASRWEVPEIRERVMRNLTCVKDLDLILDLNVRALAKGAREPYIGAPWLRYAVEHDIRISTGDDSHSVANVGQHLDATVAALIAAGGTVDWPKPTRFRHVHQHG
ncbi:MAG: histidinol-phosphatase [Pseudomonadota bacterium]